MVCPHPPVPTPSPMARTAADIQRLIPAFFSTPSPDRGLFRTTHSPSRPLQPPGDPDRGLPRPGPGVVRSETPPGVGETTTGGPPFAGGSQSSPKQPREGEPQK